MTEDRVPTPRWPCQFSLPSGERCQWPWPEDHDRVVERDGLPAHEYAPDRQVATRSATDMDTIETWGELDAWLDGRCIHARSYLDDGETAQGMGHDANLRHSARFLAYSEVRQRIAHLVARERVGRATDAAYRAAGFEDMDPLEQRR